MRTYVALFVISTLLAQMVVPIGVGMAKSRPTVEDNDSLYFPGVVHIVPTGSGGTMANNIVPFSRVTGTGGVNSSAAMGVAAMTGSVTRTVVQTGYSATPLAPMRLGGGLFAIGTTANTNCEPCENR